MGQKEKATLSLQELLEFQHDLRFPPESEAGE